MTEKITDLEALLDHIKQDSNGKGEVTVGLIIDAAGHRSFGPLLLTVGVIITSPLSGIIGLPTAMALLILIVSLQLLIGQKHFWLPDILLRRSVSKKKMDTLLRWMTPAARFIDSILRPRLSYFVHGKSVLLISFACILVAIFMPFLELIPFSSSLAGVALMAFGLALVSGDGVFALIGFFITLATAGLAAYGLLVSPIL